MTAKSLEIIQKSLSRLQLRQINVSIRNSSGKLKICRSQSGRPDRGSLYQCRKAHRFPGFSSTMLVTALHRCYTTEHEALSFQEKNYLNGVMTLRMRAAECTVLQSLLLEKWRTSVLEIAGGEAPTLKEQNKHSLKLFTTAWKRQTAFDQPLQGLHFC